MSKVILIIPYFGSWPSWITFYLHTVKKNSSIDFLFITDCDTTILNNIPNIRYQETGFEEYVERYKAVLGDEIQINNPYKICDLRPFFGIIHEKDIRGYDFFGWTDLDILYGDIRSFYTEAILKKYDVLSTHSIRLSGHFALLRNNYYYRNIGYRVYKWHDALRNPEFVGIDEHGVTNALCMTIGDKVAEKFGFSKNNMFLKLWRKIKMRKFYFKEQYTTPFTAIPWLDGSLHSDHPTVWFYINGIITNNRDGNRNFIYLHFMNFKSSLWRHDGTKAPWEGKVNIIHKNVDSMEVGIRVDENGIIDLK